MNKHVQIIYTVEQLVKGEKKCYFELPSIKSAFVMTLFWCDETEMKHSFSSGLVWLQSSKIEAGHYWVGTAFNHNELLSVAVLCQFSLTYKVCR